MIGDAIREAMGWAGSEGFHETEEAGQDELKLLLDVVDAADRFEAATRLGSDDINSARSRLHDALAAVDGAA